MTLIEAGVRASGGGDLRVANLTVRDAPAEGIAVLVPADATGIIHVSLFNVDIANNRGHGVLVNDQEDPSTQDGVQPNPNGSAASVAVEVINSRFFHNGYSVSDRDGLRVNEGGDGDLLITIKHTLASDNGADGVEVDERGAGNVWVDVFASQLLGNGQFDPADLDDGFDIDEYDDGSIQGVIAFTVANGNYEEGFDFNENNAGDLRVDMKQVEASDNREEGVDYEEDDDFAGGGDLVTVMQRVTTHRNGADDGDAGLKIREKGTGHLDVSLADIEASDNLIGGISIREDAAGNLTSAIDKAISHDNEGNGIDFDENSAGDLTAFIEQSSAFANAGVDVRADQQAPGAGALALSHVTFGTAGGNVPPTVD
jgi:hypothetical protein